MGVFKNDVGRPSNEILRKRKILKLLILMIFIFIVLSIGFMCKKSKSDMETYKVIYDYNYNDQEKIVFIEKGNKAKELEIQRENYVFIGWFLDGILFDFSKPVKKDIILVANWNAKKEDEFLIEFDSDGGTSIEKQIVKKGEKIIKPNNPIKEGYEFKCWMINENEFNFDLVVTGDLRLTAKYEKQDSNKKNDLKKTTSANITTTTSKKKFKVTFNSDGGTPVESQFVEEGQRIVKPNDPVKQGYEFKYWESQRYMVYFEQDDDIVNTVFEDTVLTAKWATPKKYEFVFSITNFNEKEVVYLGNIKSTFPKGTYIEEFISNTKNGDYKPGRMYNDENGSIGAIEVPLNKTLYYKFNIKNKEKGIDIMTNAVELKGMVPTPNITIAKNSKYGPGDFLMFDVLSSVDLEIYTSNQKNGVYKKVKELNSFYVNIDCQGWLNSPCAQARAYVPIYDSGLYYKIRTIIITSSGKKYYSDFSNTAYY